MCVDARYLGVCVAECVTLRDERVGALRLVIRAVVHLLLSCGRALLSASAPLCWRRRTSRFCVPARVCVRAVCLLCVYLGGQHEITRPANYSPPSYSASKELLA